jgi:hypothetical protein
VVERAEQEGCVGAAVGGGQRPRVADLGGAQRRGRGGGRLARLAHVQLDRVDEVAGVAALGERQGVDAGRAAHVEHHGGRRREVPREQLLRAQELEHAVAGGQTVALGGVLLVVRPDLGPH